MFKMPIRGNLALIIAIDMLGALAFAGIGLLVGSRATTTEAVSGLMNLVMLPMWLLSGVFFASSRFPDWLQGLISALPLTQLVNALRVVILKGAGPLEVALADGDPRRVGHRHVRARTPLFPVDLTETRTADA